MLGFVDKKLGILILGLVLVFLLFGCTSVDNENSLGDFTGAQSLEDESNNSVSNQEGDSLLSGLACDVSKTEIFFIDFNKVTVYPDEFAEIDLVFGNKDSWGDSVCKGGFSTTLTDSNAYYVDYKCSQSSNLEFYVMVFNLENITLAEEKYNELFDQLKGYSQTKIASNTFADESVVALKESPRIEYSVLFRLNNVVVSQKLVNRFAKEIDNSMEDKLKGLVKKHYEKICALVS